MRMRLGTANHRVEAEVASRGSSRRARHVDAPRVPSPWVPVVAFIDTETAVPAPNGCSSKTVLALHVRAPLPPMEESPARPDCLRVLLKPGWERELLRSPDGTRSAVGRIAEHKPPDGRYNIALHGDYEVTFQSFDRNEPSDRPGAKGRGGRRLDSRPRVERTGRSSSGSSSAPAGARGAFDLTGVFGPHMKPTPFNTIASTEHRPSREAASPRMESVRPGTGPYDSSGIPRRCRSRSTVCVISSPASLSGTEVNVPLLLERLRAAYPDAKARSIAGPFEPGRHDPPRSARTREHDPRPVRALSTPSDEPRDRRISRSSANDQFFRKVEIDPWRRRDVGR